ncbi:MAG: aldehyde dehydrogenase EutE [Deltaproteobacteria bacterium]|nr:aldehyde dehydrogenase EutE [Deltaproteobacteria bacterium]
MALDEQKVSAIVEAVMDRLKKDAVVSPGAPAISTSLRDTGRAGIFQDVDSAVGAARAAYQRMAQTSLEVRAAAIKAMRDVTMANLEQLSRMAVEETGLGRVEDKIGKNRLAALKTPGLEILAPRAYSGDNGLALVERAAYGVICSITPCTNATETVINNCIGMIAGGNAVVINPHPTAKKTTVHYIRMLNEAMTGAGAPDNMICTVPEPTIESAQKLMSHPGVNLVVVTGGPAVVKAAMSTGKKCIAAGPGNPPVVVDETARLDRAARGIIAGASLDNNIVCIVEKEVLAVEAIADRLKQELVRAGAYYIKDALVPRVTKLVIDGEHANKAFVGKNPSVILREVGVDIGDEVRLAFCEVDEGHPLVQVEQLMPIMPFVRVRNVDEAINTAVRVEHGFRHTAVMHSLNIENLHNFARRADTSIFVKNAPSSAGLGLDGEGYTSWTIASPTGEGLTTALNFTRERRCTLKDYFRIV